MWTMQTLPLNSRPCVAHSTTLHSARRLPTLRASRLVKVAAKRGSKSASESAGDAMDSAGESLKTAADDAAKAVSDGADQAADAWGDAVDSTSDGLKEAGSEMQAVAKDSGLTDFLVEEDKAEAGTDLSTLADRQVVNTANYPPPATQPPTKVVVAKKPRGPTTTTTARQQVKAGADELADNIEEGADELADNIEEAADSLADGVKDAARTASRAQAELGETAKEVADATADQVQKGADQLATSVQKGVDAAADGVKQAQQQLDEVQRELSVPGPPAPFASNPLFAQPVRSSDASDKDFAKLRLLYAVAGVDRGFAANPSAVTAIDTAVNSLIAASGETVLLNWTPRKRSPEDEEPLVPSTMKAFNGTWRLVYSSAFAKPLGGTRPSPPFGFLPASLGQVYQVVDSSLARLDNVVELYSRFNPSLPGLPPTEPVVATLTLRHTFEAIGGPSVQITFEDTLVKATGGVNGILGKLPLPDMLPQLPEPFRPTRSSRSSIFDILYLDEDMRITRGAGKRRELRVFVRS